MDVSFTVGNEQIANNCKQDSVIGLFCLYQHIVNALYSGFRITIS
mgnify:CR=1 FL=1